MFVLVGVPFKGGRGMGDRFRRMCVVMLFGSDECVVMYDDRVSLERVSRRLGQTYVNL